MEPLFQFLGSYWWLIFPLMGVMGGVGSAWERGARRRHKRRLEVLHAKAELKAAQAGTRAPAVGAAIPAADHDGDRGEHPELTRRPPRRARSSSGSSPRTTP